MTSSSKYYCFEDGAFRKILYSPLKKSGFVPEKDSEIFVSGIPETATVHDLARFFETVGEIFQTKLMMKGQFLPNRGFGFVTYMDKATAKKALKELKQKPFMGGPCIFLQKSVDNCRIFVGGVPAKKTKDEIWHELRNTYDINNIVDVIAYRSYSNPKHNRGFVFLEFRTHEEASHFRAKYSDKLYLFGKLLLVDWSVPILDTDPEILTKVKILFLRNLDVTQTSEEFARFIYQLMDRKDIEKVYKFKDYAYIHMVSRQQAEILMNKLKHHYHDTTVEISFAKPPNKFTDKTFREKALTSRRATQNWYANNCYGMAQTSDSAQTSSAHSYSSVSMSPPNNYELMSQLSLTAVECLELENKWKELMTKRLTLQNQLANVNTDSGNISNSSGQLSTNSSASYIRMNEIPDLLSVKTPSIPTSLFTAMNENRANYSNHPSTQGIFQSPDLGDMINTLFSGDI